MASDNYVAPVFLTDQAKDLNDRFYLILNNLVDIYPDYKLKPTATSIEDNTKTNLQVYTDNMNKMMKLQTEYFIYKNTIVRNSQDLLDKMNSIDDQINILDKENKKLSRQIGEMANSGYSAEGMLDDTQITRNQIFYGNIFLFIIMMSGGYMYYKKVIKTQ